MLRSAGLLPYRRSSPFEVLIAHPGGPFFARKDAGAWSIVKGLVEEGEDFVAAAVREFGEETGWSVPDRPLHPLGEVKQRGGKVVSGFAVEADFELEEFNPGTFQMEWRGALRSFPEIDRVRWVDADEARRLLNPAQIPFVDRLEVALIET